MRERLQVWLLPTCMVAVNLFMLGISLGWRPSHDLPLMMYCGFLMEEAGQVPYRDIFEMNAPGTHLLYWGIVKLFGTAEFSQVLLNAVWLLTTQIAILLFLKRWGIAVALCSASAFSIQCLGWGSAMMLQRELLCILPLVLCLLLTFRCPRIALNFRGAGIGLLLGGVVAIKPTFLIYFPSFVLTLLYWSERERLDESEPSDARDGSFGTKLRALFPMSSLGTSAKLFGASLAGFAVVPLACFVYLQATGAWSGFLEMSTEYWPLYAEIRGNAKVGSGLFERQRIVLALNESAKFKFLGITAVAAFAFLPGLLRERGRERFEVWTLLGLCALGFLYAVSTGKYWNYHMLPLYFGYSLIAGFAVRGIVQAREPQAQSWLRPAVLLVLFALPLRFPEGMFTILEGHELSLDRDIELVAKTLQEHAQPEDKAQPLDVTSGAVHAMLLAKVELATPFLYDFHFYHHPASQTTKRLRKEMLASMRVARPRFVIVSRRPWRPFGSKAAPGFNRLDELIATQYAPLYSGAKLVLMERKEASDR